MGIIKDLFATVFRDYNTDGLPATGEHDPVKGEIRDLGNTVDSTVSAIATALLAAGATAYDTRAALFGDLSRPDKAIAVVYADATLANRGMYVKNGAAGAGAWVATGLLATGPAGPAGKGDKGDKGNTGDKGPQGENLYQFALRTGAIPSSTSEANFLQVMYAQIAASAPSSIVGQAQAQADRAAAQASTATTQAAGATAQAGIATAQRQAADVSAANATAAAQTVAQLAGIAKVYPTQAAATADVANVAANALVEVLVDETHGNDRTVYQKKAGALVYVKTPSPYSDLADATNPAKGAALVGYRAGRTVQTALDRAVARAIKYAVGGNQDVRVSMDAYLGGNKGTDPATFTATSGLWGAGPMYLSQPRTRIASYTWVNSADVKYATATIKTAVPHGLQVGDLFVVGGLNNNAQNIVALNGHTSDSNGGTFAAPNYAAGKYFASYPVATVVDPLTFTATVPASYYASPDTSADGVIFRAPRVWLANERVFTYVTHPDRAMRHVDFNANGGDPAASGNNPNYYFPGPQSGSIYRGVRSKGPGAFEFVCHDDSFELVAEDHPALRIYVDGTPLLRDRYAAPPEPSYPGWSLNYTFAKGARRRIIRVELNECQLCGVLTRTPTGLARVEGPRRKLRALCVGDSFGEGTGAAEWLVALFNLFCQRQGWEATYASVGSTGVTTSGGRTDEQGNPQDFAYRLGNYHKAGYEPDVVLTLDTVNDGSNITVDNATAYINKVRALWGQVPVIILGRLRGTPQTNPDHAYSSAAWRTACQNEGCVYVDGGIGAFGDAPWIDQYNTTSLQFRTYYWGGQAQGTATLGGGGVTGVTITDPGEGYDPASPLPAVTFAGGGGNGAAGTAVVNFKVGDVQVMKGGYGYTQATLKIDHGARATAIGYFGQGDSPVLAINVDQEGGNFTVPPTVVIGGPGNGATAVAVLEGSRLARIDVTNGGTGYTARPTVTLVASDADCTATAVIQNGAITGVNITNRGSRFRSCPICVVTGDGAGAELVPFLSGVVESVTITAAGSGYTSVPGVTIGHPNGNDATHPKTNGHKLSAHRYSINFEGL